MMECAPGSHVAGTACPAMSAWTMLFAVSSLPVPPLTCAAGACKRRQLFQFTPAASGSAARRPPQACTAAAAWSPWRCTWRAARRSPPRCPTSCAAPACSGFMPRSASTWTPPWTWSRRPAARRRPRQRPAARPRRCWRPPGCATSAWSAWARRSCRSSGAPPAPGRERRAARQALLRRACPGSAPAWRPAARRCRDPAAASQPAAAWPRRLGNMRSRPRYAKARVP